MMLTRTLPVATLALATMLLAACNRPADQAAMAAATDTAQVAAVPATAMRGATVDTISGAYCEDRSAPFDPTRDRERANGELAASADPARRAQRDGGTLWVPLPDGRRLAFVDCPTEDEAARYHWYQGMDEAGIGHLVMTYYYEGTQVFWVHGTSGNVTPLATAPVFAPDGRHFAIANVDLEAGYSDNIFAIFRVTESGAEEVFRETGDDEFGATTIIWDSPSVVYYSRVYRASTPGEVLHVGVTATREGDSWRLQDVVTRLP